MAYQTFRKRETANLIDSLSQQQTTNHIVTWFITGAEQIDKFFFWALID